MPTRNLLVLAAMLDQLAKATDGGLRPYDERRAP